MVPNGFVRKMEYICNIGILDKKFENIGKIWEIGIQDIDQNISKKLFHSLFRGIADFLGAIFIAFSFFCLLPT